MSENPIARQRVVLELPGMEDVLVQRDTPYRGTGPDAGAVPDAGADNGAHAGTDNGARAGTGASVAAAAAGGAAGGLGMGSSRLGTFDLYRPPGTSATPLPAVIFVTGYSDVGAEKMLGCKLKEMAAYDGWARLVACSGLVAITYDNEDPVHDVHLLLEHVKCNAVSLGVDAARLGIWSCSGNVPNALALLAQHGDFQCAALCYGYMLDDDEGSEVADAAKQYYFANPTAGLSPAAFAHLPVLLVRAGRDETPGLNASLDRFIGTALEENLPLSVLNHRGGPHAFDVLDPSERSKAIIRQVLCFLQTSLTS